MSRRSTTLLYSDIMPTSAGLLSLDISRPCLNQYLCYFTYYAYIPCNTYDKPHNKYRYI